MKNRIIISVFFLFSLFFSFTVFADTTINLQIKTNANTIFDNSITVASCDSDNDPVTPDIITAYCALVQSGIPSNWAGLWINSINSVLNNEGGNGVYWMWLVNLNIDMSLNSPYSLSAKQYVLQDNDKILFYYNTNPLDVIVDKENPKVGDSIKIIGKELGLDSFWNPVWNNTLSGKVIINGVEHDLNENSEFTYEIVNSDALSIKIKKDGFIDSKELNINPEEVRRSSGSSGSYITNFIQPVVVTKVFSIENALKFLKTNQQIDGSYGATMYTDWVAVAAGAGDDKEIKSKLINYLKENDIDSLVVTDNERRAMALMSLGINPYNETKVNYIKKITDSFDGVQFGDKTLVNDDIFALIILKNAGYSVNDELIIKGLNYIISKQNKEGSWGSIDMTAAGIQTLKSFENIAGVNDAILKAEKFLTANQKTDGGFENSSSTSWVLQALFENEEILKGEVYLASKQNIDGGMEGVETDLNTRIWTTAYVIPAILHKPWGIILNNFSKPDINILTLNKNETIKQNKKVAPKISNVKNVEVIKNTEDKKKIENIVDNNGEAKINKSSSIWRVFKTPFSWLLGKLGF